jgi:hypothetical protein
MVGHKGSTIIALSLFGDHGYPSYGPERMELLWLR